MLLLITAGAEAAKPVPCVSVRMCLYVSEFLPLGLSFFLRSLTQSLLIHKTRRERGK